MSKIPQHKLDKYRQIYQNLSNIEAQGEVIRNFVKRTAKQKVQILSTQNLSWLGFFKAPFSQDFANADITILGCGVDNGTLSETGNMRHAPLYLRFQSRFLTPIHDEWQVAPLEMARIIDMGDVDLMGLDYARALDHAEMWMQRAANAGNLLLTFGGEHSVGHGFEPACVTLAKKYYGGAPLAGILFDGHADMITAKDMGAYTERKRGNANFLTQSMADGVVDPEKLLCFGMKEMGSSAIAGFGAAKELGVTVVTPLQVFEKGPQYYADMVRERVGDSPCIIECDLDGLDPVAGGGGISTRDGFGLRWEDYRIISRALRGKNIVGANVVEYAPAFDPNRAMAANVTHLAFEYLCMLTETKVRLNGGQLKPTQWTHNMSTSVGYFGEGLL